MVADTHLHQNREKSIFLPPSGQRPPAPLNAPHELGPVWMISVEHLAVFSSMTHLAVFSSVCTWYSYRLTRAF